MPKYGYRYSYGRKQISEVLCAGNTKDIAIQGDSTQATHRSRPQPTRYMPLLCAGTTKDIAIQGNSTQATHRSHPQPTRHMRLPNRHPPRVLRAFKLHLPITSPIPSISILLLRSVLGCLSLTGNAIHPPGAYHLYN